ncbi:MAG: outer membrane beta-barrel protein [Schleiferiaceae bacterium]|nr:outer membrane beta-barrel protein [Schleiferiaceae bacterium]
MKKQLALLLMIGFACIANAQKDEEIEYYTDDVVNRSKVFASAHYSPYFLNRNIISSESFPDDPVNVILNSSAKGGYGYAIGIDLYYKLNKGLNLGLGVNRSAGSYTIDYKQALETAGFPTDSLAGDYIMTTNVSYINIPLQFMYGISMNDLWDLEVVPQIEMNIVDNINRTATQTFDDERGNLGDQTDKAQQINWTVGIGIGINYYISESFSFFLRPQVRYMLRPMIPNDELNEVLLWLGGQAGLRLYF